ncbi:purine-binding chemotaxis protein CheW [Desulfosalsimonas propionicica]|uniref:Chemotaxis protein CheW n=1 Tax=Desulfosalsimonas propionicica TaxID=332175 RepID=A0A7W0CBH9_9BACT|nr:chemotaxis protein CheW [Desulfosalsimonas propionicica]MBA2882675.1 purine-binding chemotaxis protein CheW [Desulfosalsimonas propionicica]
MTQTAQKNNETNESLANLAGKYLTFLLGDESYGIEILKVQEIIGMQSITRIPRTPEYVKGVINLRGKVIPVIDLRLRFGMEAAEVSRKTCIIVVQVAKADINVTMGIVVDEVSEVLEIAAAEIEPAPGFGTRVETSFIMGMAKTESAVKILLDIDKIMSENEMEALAKSTG